MPAEDDGSAEPVPNSRSVFLTPLGIAVTYVVFGMGWILFSDAVVWELASDTDFGFRLQVAKGWLFIAVTGILVYALVRRSTRALTAEVDERRKAQTALRKALLEAERASMAKSEFLAVMSHEFRTPLNAILGFSEAIRSGIYGPPGPPKYQEYADHIHRSGLLIKKLIDDVLAVVELESRKRPVRREHLDLTGLLHRCLDEFAGMAADSGVTLTLRKDEPAEPLYGDPICVHQIVNNLLANALQSTGEGGEVRVCAVSDESGCAIVVADSGKGIPEDKLPAIVRPFSTTLPSPDLARGHAGLGLGLAMVNALAEAHGGTLRISSKLGSGTKVRVWFPAVPPAP